MKQISLIFPFVLLLLFTNAAKAQKNDTYFVGKWDVVIKGLPKGDTEALVNFQLKDGKLAGSITDKEEKKDMPFTAVNLKDSTVVVKFDHSSGEIEMNLLKKDENNLTGQINNQFDLTGIRKKED
ncbi:hypothetical protein HDF26_000204 [Pedobacter cryoconitis]|uniref:Uncharacterized protein n=1 Tax=Pedobacter cryoconitis TaxID=188932 RepID=A0A7W8ZNN7_9SPHI|nr:hypothetical protein [Pedobacter cryoconitis]MBB5637347.1 hypothetical protein [Pedobacter cryoconitis]MBB6269777.1 hypothetical protein [Pedobacter cryoconitis]